MKRKQLLASLLLGIALNPAYAYILNTGVAGKPDINHSALLTVTKEPPNIAYIKQQAIVYHDSGQYEKDIKTIANEATQYLAERLKKGDFNGKKPAVVFDIDETSLSNYNDMVKLNFGSTEEDIIWYENQGFDPAISPVLALYKYAKAHGVVVFFITGRQEDQLKPTEANLKKVGYANWDGLILRHGEFKRTSAVVYKTAMRKEIAEKGYDVIFTIGDQMSDLNGGYADKTFKVPNPYYLIP
jgi:acid phosphatase